MRSKKPGRICKAMLFGGVTQSSLGSANSNTVKDRLCVCTFLTTHSALCPSFLSKKALFHSCPSKELKARANSVRPATTLQLVLLHPTSANSKTYCQDFPSALAQRWDDHQAITWEVGSLKGNPVIIRA